MPEEVPQRPMTEEESSLERLRAKLYSAQVPAAFTPPVLSHTGPTGASQAWEPPEKPEKKRLSWAVIFLGVAVLFFVVAGGLSFVFLLHGGRSVSTDNLSILLPVPTAIASGTVVPLVVTIQNHNPAAITDTDITIDFPDGTRSADDVTQPLVRYADTLGTIPAGGSANRTIQAVLFGSANQSVSIPVTIDYHTAGSNAMFTKKQTYVFTITSSPLTITAQAVGSVAVGQPFTIALQVRSTATTPLDNIAVSAAFPFGFIPSTAKGTAGAGPLYTLGTLNSGEEKNLTITGTLAGSNNDQRNFQFTVGTMKDDGSKTLSVAYASQSTNVTISKPFLATTLSLNHESTSPIVVLPGEPVAGQVTWVNTLPTTLANGQVSVKLSGNALDPASVSATNGFYDSSTNTILFSRQSDSSLGLLNSGDTGTGAFTLSTKTGAALAALRNPTIQVSVSVSGQPGTGASQTITNSVTNTIQLATDLELASRVVRTTGPFKNSGPWPPVPNKASTYTVELALTNTVNSVAGATATMILPEYVTFAGQTSPNDGSITYDDATRTVSWKVADVPAGTGTSLPALGAAFQISFTPSVTQRGTSPVLVGNQTLTGVDRFTSAEVGNTAQALSTEITTDPAYQASFGIVGN